MPSRYPEPLEAVAAATGADPYTFLFTGGDDHALAATFPAADAVPESWLVVGRAEAVDHDHSGVLVDGTEWSRRPALITSVRSDPPSHADEPVQMNQATARVLTIAGSDSGGERASKPISRPCSPTVFTA